MNALKEYYEENDGGGQRMLKYDLINFISSFNRIFELFDFIFNLFPSRIAVMVGQWGVPGVVIVFATIYWIMGISKYISG